MYSIWPLPIYKPHQEVGAICLVAFPIDGCVLLGSSFELPDVSCAVSIDELQPACLFRHPMSDSQTLRLHFGAGWAWRHPETKKTKTTWKGIVANEDVHTRLVKWHSPLLALYIFQKSIDWVSIDTQKTKKSIFQIPNHCFDFFLVIRVESS